MEIITILRTNRSDYDIKVAADDSITVGELIEYLENNCNRDSRIVFSNDGGYTYGYLTERAVDTVCHEEEPEEDLELTREDQVGDIERAIKENGGEPIKVGCVWLDENLDIEVLSVGYDKDGKLCANLSGGTFTLLDSMSDDEVDNIWFESTQIRR